MEPHEKTREEKIANLHNVFRVPESELTVLLDKFDGDETAVSIHLFEKNEAENLDPSLPLTSRFSTSSIPNNSLKRSKFNYGVIIYYDDKIPSTIAECDKISQYLFENRIPNQKVNVSNDIEQISWLKAKVGGELTLPVTLMNNKFLGDYSDIYNNIEKIEQESARNMIRNSTREDLKQLSQTSNEIEIGFVNKALNLGQSFLSIFNPFSYVGTGNDPVLKDENAIEFAVARTNWMNRKQKRIIRFVEDGIYRIDPITHEQKDKILYSQVQKFVVDDKANDITIFLDSGKIEYWSATPQAFTYIIALFVEKCNVKVEKK